MQATTGGRAILLRQFIVKALQSNADQDERISPGELCGPERKGGGLNGQAFPKIAGVGLSLAGIRGERMSPKSSSRPFVAALLCLGGLAVGSLSGCANAEPAELLFEANTSELPSEATMDVTRAIVVQRIEALGVPGARVEREGAKRILVRLADRADADAVRTLLDRRGRIEFRLVDDSVGQEELAAARLDTRMLPVRGQGTRIALQRRAILTGDMILDARPSFNMQGEPAVAITFDAAGTRRFAQATRENVRKLFAIVIDGEVISAPMINEPIMGGQAEIAGSFTVEETNQLAIALRSGALPVDLEVVEERVTGGK